LSRPSAQRISVAEGRRETTRMNRNSTTTSAESVISAQTAEIGQERRFYLRFGGLETWGGASDSCRRIYL
jgi:hypothetical protein